MTSEAAFYGAAFSAMCQSLALVSLVSLTGVNVTISSTFYDSEGFHLHDYCCSKVQADRSSCNLMSQHESKGVG